MSLSEDSYRTDLIQKLNSKLPNPYKAVNSLNLSISSEDERYKHLKKLRREFDVIILDDTFIDKKKVNVERVEYAIETKKLGSSCIGIGQAEDAFVAFPFLKITYATNFEGGLYRRERDSAESMIKFSSYKLDKIYEQIADLISDDVRTKISLKIEAKHIDITESEAIDILTECMNKIQNEMTELPDEKKVKLNERTLIMWKKYDENNVDVVDLEYNVKRAASYIIVDQFLFYYLLCKKAKKYNLKELSPISDEEDDPEIFSVKYFKRAISETNDYRPIFELDFLSLLPKTKKVVKSINEVVKIISNLGLEFTNEDILGKIFHSMIPLEIRKQIAAYYTGNAPAKILTNLAITSSKMKVGDLACGSGTLLVESYHVLKKLLKQSKIELNDSQIHKQIIENQIFGNDITLFASHLAAMNLASQNLEAEITKINITSTNGLNIIPIKKSYSNLRGYLEQFEARGTDIDGNQIGIKFPVLDCVIMNPPFSRQTDMTDEIIDNLKSICKEWFPVEKEYKKYIDGQMGLHNYFIIHADKMIKKFGIIAMVLPSVTFSNIYSKKTIKYLKDKNYHIKYIMEILSERCAFSEDSSFKEYMVIIQKGKYNIDSETSIISFKDEFEIDSVPDLIKNIKDGKSLPNMTIRKIKNSNLYSSSKWNEIIVNKFDKITEFLISSKKLDKLNNIKSNLRIRRGFYPSYSDFLMLPNNEWKIKKVNESLFSLEHITLPKDDAMYSVTIPSKFLLPSIRRSKTANDLVVKPDSFTLNLPYILPKELDNFRRIYLHWAEQKIDTKWEEASKKGHKRIPIIKKPKFKNIKRKGKIIQIVKDVPWWSFAYHDKCYDKNGNLFLCKKYRGKLRTTFSMYSPETASISCGSMHLLNSSDSEFYASWTNSSLYLYILFTHQKVISKGYWEITVGNFKEFLFPISSYFTDDDKNEVIQKWKKLSNIVKKNKIFLPKQFKMDDNTTLNERKLLDIAWLNIFGMENSDLNPFITNLYKWILNYFETR